MVNATTISFAKYYKEGFMNKYVIKGIVTSNLDIWNRQKKTLDNCHEIYNDLLQKYMDKKDINTSYLKVRFSELQKIKKQKTYFDLLLNNHEQVLKEINTWINRK